MRIAKLIIVFLILNLGLVTSCSRGELLHSKNISPLHFPKMEIDLENRKFLMEVADTEERRRKGLSGRKNIGEADGMLFIFDTPQKVVFVMEDTFFPLSIGFFNEENILEQVEHMMPETKDNLKEAKLYKSRRKVKYAIEVPIGWFSRNKIFIGAKLRNIK